VQVGFKDYQASMIASAVSELARNIEKYARRGEIVLRRVSQSYATGIEIIAQDEGPGIANPEEAMKDQKICLRVCHLDVSKSFIVIDLMTH